jgi:hypothetical protein
MRALLITLVFSACTALVIGAGVVAIGFEPTDSQQVLRNGEPVTVSAMTDGMNRNRGTRPHHPRATCGCN